MNAPPLLGSCSSFTGRFQIYGKCRRTYDDSLTPCIELFILLVFNSAKERWHRREIRHQNFYSFVRSYIFDFHYNGSCIHNGFNLAVAVFPSKTPLARARAVRTQWVTGYETRVHEKRTNQNDKDDDGDKD